MKEGPGHSKDLQGPGGPRGEGILLGSVLVGARGCAAPGRMAVKDQNQLQGGTHMATGGLARAPGK